MYQLSNKELNNIVGGAINTPFHLIYKIIRTIKIKLLIRKVFID